MADRQLDRLHMFLLSALASTRWVLAADIDRRVEERLEVQRVSGPGRCPFTKRFGALVSTPPSLVGAVATIHIAEAGYFFAEVLDAFVFVLFDVLARARRILSTAFLTFCCF